LRDAEAREDDAIKLINDVIDALAPGHAAESEREAVVSTLWSLQKPAIAIEKANREIEQMRAEIWEPFARSAHVLDHFGYLDSAKEKVTERGKWLADLRVDRPLLIGEALQRNLFATLNPTHAAALIAALAADEDRDYGELELEDPIVSLLVKFEEISFDVSTEEWKQGIEAAPEINFSAASAAAHWANGAEWQVLVHETRAEEGDLVRLLSRTGEGLLPIARLRGAHSPGAPTASTPPDN